MTRPKTRLRERLREKVRRGWCRKNLHRLVGDNVYIGSGGRRRCLVCQRQRHAEYRREVQADLGYRYVKCVVRGCKAQSERTLDSSPYVCQKHRTSLLEVA